jgi:hypothetical protein
MRLRLREEGGHAAEANRLETDLRRKDGFPRSFDRKLVLPVPFALLDQEQ